MRSRLILELMLESIFDDVSARWIQQGADPGAVEGAVDLFNVYKKRQLIKGSESDILLWSKGPFSSFETFIGNIKKKDSIRSMQKKIEGDAKKEFENDKVVVVVPNTFEASKKYGAGTKWCISGNIKKHWDDYISAGIKFYFVLSKVLPNTDPLYKVAVAVYPNGKTKEVYNAVDRRVNGKQFNDYAKVVGIEKLMFENPYDWNIWLSAIKHTKNADGTISVDGDVRFGFGLGIVDGELPFAFKEVTGSFYCNNCNLTSLDGVPRIVGDEFHCDFNKLTSLKGAPHTVGGNFYCNNNRLTSLRGAPHTVGGDFHCSENRLTSLEGAPRKCRMFSCSRNQLQSLVGGPQEVNAFFAVKNRLISLEGGPKIVKDPIHGFDYSLEMGSYNVSFNRLTSLVGAPSKIIGNFSCHGNSIISLDGAPQIIRGDFSLDAGLKGKMPKVKGKIHKFNFPRSD